jgi:hypothetical protein
VSRSGSLLGVGVLAVTALVLVIVSPWVRHQLALSFTRQPDTYTELYFAGSRPVSGTDIANQPQVIVSFVVANHENGPTRYSYLVRVLDAAGRLAAQRAGSISVANGEERSNRVALAVPAGSAWSTVDVNLLNRSEAIHYTAPDARTPGN